MRALLAAVLLLITTTAVAAQSNLLQKYGNVSPYKVQKVQPRSKYVTPKTYYNGYQKGRNAAYGAQLKIAPPKITPIRPIGAYNYGLSDYEQGLINGAKDSNTNDPYDY